MKKILWCISFFAFTSAILAQENPSLSDKRIFKNHFLKVNLLSPFAATIGGSYEYAFNPSLSVENGASFTQLILDNNPKRYTAIEGFSFCSEIKTYKVRLGRQNGWFNTFFIRYNSYQFSRYKQDSSTGNKVIPIREEMQGISLGFGKGYRRIYQNRFVIEGVAGIYISVPTYYKNTLDASLVKQYDIMSFKENPMTNGIGLRLGLKAGYLF